MLFGSSWQTWQTVPSLHYFLWEAIAPNRGDISNIAMLWEQIEWGSYRKCSPLSEISTAVYVYNQGVSISELRWCRNSQKGSEPKNFKIWKSSLPYGGLWENEVINCHYHLHCIIPEIFRIVCGTFWRHSLLARNSPGWPGRKILLPSLPENFKIPGKSSAWLAWDTFHSRLARQEKSSAWPAWRVSSQ